MDRSQLKELEIACLKEAKRNFYVILFGIIEPLLQKVPPTLLLPALVVTPPPSPAQTNLVASETSLEVGINSGLKNTMVKKKFILKILDHLKARNYEVKE